MYVFELHTETRTTTNSNLAVLFKCRSNSAGQATKTHLLRGRKFTFENRWRQLRSRHIREILQRNKGVWGGGGNSINYKIPTELVWLGKFDCPEIIEEDFLNNFEFFCTRNLLYLQWITRMTQRGIWHEGVLLLTAV